MTSHFDAIDHEATQYALPKLRSAGKVKFGDIHGVLPFTGLRNPISVSSTSYKVSFQYKTAANNWMPRLGLVESGGELAVAEEMLVSPKLHDLEFQPIEIRFRHPDGAMRTHYPDLRQTLKSGRKRLIFVRNASSLNKQITKDEIAAIVAATPKHEAHEFVVVDADSYSRPRRENLRRMHRLLAFQPDPEADEIVYDAVKRCRTLWTLSSLFPFMALSQARIFQSTLRLIALGRLVANMDAVISHHSRIWEPAA